MTVANVSDKWQVTLPANIRKKVAGLRQKGKVEVEVRGNEIILRPIKSIMELSGILHEYAKDKPTDWKTIRAETERIAAEECKGEKLNW